MSYSDVVIVGAGIIGLAHAYHAARAGLSVTVLERDAHAQGASVRNFGMLAIATQSEGKQLNIARRCLESWKKIAPLAGLELTQTGGLFLAREPEEHDVLNEYYHSSGSTSDHHKLISPDDLSTYATEIRSNNVLGALWCDDFWKIDQRQATQKIALFLQREYGITFCFSTEALSIIPPQVETTAGTFRCSHTIVCGGSDFLRLFPAAFAETGVMQCELQMLRTHPQPAQWICTPALMGGLSLARYSAFEQCSSLEQLKIMQRDKYAPYLEHGIHLIVRQESDGSVTIGDSHHYEADVTGDRSNVIDQLILDEMNKMIALPQPHIAQRWKGHYAYLPGTDMLQFSPIDNVTVTTMTNGLGMTQGFAIAEDTINTLF